MNELSVTSPYKEMLEKYEKEDAPILSRGLTIDVKSDIENGCYVMNNKGEKCPVKLKSVPRYVNHVCLNPQEVDYLIEQQIIFND